MVRSYPPALHTIHGYLSTLSNVSIKHETPTYVASSNSFERAQIESGNTWVYLCVVYCKKCPIVSASQTDRNNHKEITLVKTLPCVHLLRLGVFRIPRTSCIQFPQRAQVIIQQIQQVIFALDAKFLHIHTRPPFFFSVVIHTNHEFATKL